MLSVVDAVASRRMIRSFQPDALTVDELELLIDAAHRGPSAGNTRSLELLVLAGDEASQYWDATLSESRRESFPWPGLLRAPVLLIPYVDPGRYVDRYAEPDKSRTGLGTSVDVWPVPYWWVDGGAAVENVLLTAAALGLGACFFGQFEHEVALRDRFEVPETFRAIGTIAVGYADAEAEQQSGSARRPRRPTEVTTHRGRWQNTDRT